MIRSMGRALAFKTALEHKWSTLAGQLHCATDFGLKVTSHPVEAWRIHFLAWTQAQNSRGDSGRPVGLAAFAALAGGVSALLLEKNLVARCHEKTSFTENQQEFDVGAIEEFPPGEMRTVKIKEKELLITNVNGQLYCTGSSCPHYHAPLVKGVATTTPSVMCPWHAAEFCLKLGKPLNGPSLDGIPVYPVSVDKDGHVRVRVAGSESGPVGMARRDPRNKTTFGIVGSGAAALAAAEVLRQEGFTGRIVMFGKEPHPPYDRPVLSKNLAAKIEKLHLRPAEFLLREAEIEYQPNTPVVSVDAASKRITTAAGTTLDCDKILIATGGIPRRLELPGAQLANVETLRCPEDAERISRFAHLDAYVVVIGSSFIGCEVAAALARGGAKVTVVGRDQVPFATVLGEKIGRRLMHLLNTKKVNFRMETEVKELIGKGGKVAGVVLANGDTLQADLVVLGVGVSPATDMVKNVKRLSDGSLAVNPFMEVEGYPGIFAAGDIATFPYYKTGEAIRVEHWNVALQQGRVAAKNMLGKMEPYTAIPFFWSMMLGKSIRYAGYCPRFDEVMIEGDLESLQFTAFYVRNEKIQAIATCGKDPVAVAGIEALKRNTMFSPLEYHIGYCNANTLLQKAKAELGRSHTGRR